MLTDFGNGYVLTFLYRITNPNQENVAGLCFFLCFLLVVWGEICTFAVIL